MFSVYCRRQIRVLRVLCEASVPSGLWESSQYCIVDWIVQKTNQSRTWLFSWILLSRPSMNHSWEAWNQRSLKCPVQNITYRRRRSNSIQLLSHSAETWNQKHLLLHTLYLDTACLYMNPFLLHPQNVLCSFKPSDRELYESVKKVFSFLN